MTEIYIAQAALLDSLIFAIAVLAPACAFFTFARLFWSSK